MTQKKTTELVCSGAPRAGASRMALVSALSAALLCFAAPQSAVAQTADDAPVLFLDISTGLSFEDGLNNDDFHELSTFLGLGYFTATDSQRLSFETGITARARQGDAELIDPFILIDYAHFTRDAEVGVNFSYRSSEVGTGDLDDDFDANDLAQQTGRRDDVAVVLRLVTGQASPFGTNTQLRFAQTTFSDGATENDTETHSIQSTLRFTVDPRIILTMTGAWSQEETDDFLDTVETTHRLTFGANLAIDRVWTAAATLGFAEIETRTNVATVSVEGLEGSFILTRDLPNGALVFSTNHVVTTDGWRNSLRVRRSIELANGDTFDASLGHIFFEEGGSGHLASLNFNRTVRRGALSFGVDFTTDLDAADFYVYRTQLNAALRHDITDDSSWSFNGSVANVEYENAATIDAKRVELGVAYLHALSNDWTLAARARHIVLYENGDLDDRTNIFSLDFERRFSIRP